jgi:hypothetical protein
MPDAAKANTKAGAIAFVRYYVELQNYASTSGETDALRALAATDCASCRAITDLIDRVYGAGGHIDGTGWEFLTASAADIAAGPTDLQYIDVAFRIHSQAIFVSPGASPSTYKGSPRRLMTFGLSRPGAAWHVARIVGG